ncbi:helix-turn-helix domain-containing protein [Nordella sp. HKS 07]|uniref:helix-turn-helix domain-containing protein n=1 Tax=Nordella sp. HKS 07 TaxID=2712222 RepID=UPI0013E1665C|nr:helix-turn-helix domain-containing protein [Nordella sp. HKS 07]QIG47574.1 helix-turn-helix domain-containing protein [Nordella sp. HKS 07]
MTEPIAVPVLEAARLGGVGRSTLYCEIQKGNLRVLKVGRRSLILVADLRAWLASKAKDAGDA